MLLDCTKYRKPIHGSLIDLVPLSKSVTKDLVRIRNMEHVRSYFDEKEYSTEETQNIFVHNYLKKNDDLYWVICLKSGKVIGSDRLYNITNIDAEKGSFTLDEAYTMRAPYALESLVLVLNLAFNNVGLSSVYGCMHPDNDKVISMHKRLGFVVEGKKDVRGIGHILMRLNKEDYIVAPHVDLINYFAEREKKLASLGKL